MPGSAAIGGLRFAVRVRVVAKYLGQAFLMLAALTCVPAAVAGITGGIDSRGNPDFFAGLGGSPGMS